MMDLFEKSDKSCVSSKEGGAYVQTADIAHMACVVRNCGVGTFRRRGVSGWMLSRGLRTKKATKDRKSSWDWRGCRGRSCDSTARAQVMSETY